MPELVRRLLGRTWIVERVEHALPLVATAPPGTLFLTRDGGLLANEFAPRVHNSGHWTTDACSHSQFEQHIRAVCGWPLADPARHSDAEMINLLGEEALGWRAHLEAGASLHLYGKREVVAGRKMGHATRIGPRL
jgi:5-(carboxyamino)imidazole ribonucleotide synthase